MGIWIVNFRVCEAFSSVAEESEEKITFVVIFLTHDLVEAFLAQGLHQDFFATHVNTFRLKIVLLDEVWRVATVYSIRHAVQFLELISAAKARVCCDTWREKWFVLVVGSVTVRHSSKLLREIQAEIQTSRVPQVDFYGVVLVGHIEVCLHVDDFFAT